MERGRPRPLRARRPRSIRTTAAGRDKSPFIVESIDNFTANRRLAQVFEARIGKGKLIFSSIDLITDSQLPELRQMQYSLLRYMLTDDFQPSAAITEANLRSLLMESATEQKTTATSIYE